MYNSFLSNHREAAENVGCNILRVISEPAAALLAYGEWGRALLLINRL